MRILVLLLGLALFLPPPAQAGWFKRAKPSTTVVSDTTLLPGTTYYFPSGLQSAEDSWYNVGAVGAAPSIFAFGLSVDSVAGFDADSSVVKIEAIFGFESATDTVVYEYGDDNIVARWYVWNDTTTFLTRTDLGRLINCGLPAHERRRYKITVLDTVKIRRFYEIPAKP